MHFAKLGSIEHFDYFISQNSLTLVSFSGYSVCPDFVWLLDHWANKFPSMVTVGILNAGTSPEIQMMYEKYEIEKVPTFIFFKNGQVVDKIDSRDPREVVDAIQKHGQ